MNKWELYILRCADGTLYTGISNDVESRFRKHQKGTGAKYTRGRGPLELVYREDCEDHSAALKREYQIKKLTREEKELLIRKGTKKMAEFRFAEEKDTHLILKFIKDLASYEQMLDQVVATEELLREWIFEKKKAEVIFAMENGREVGFALFFHNFSTFLGRAGLYLEDLFVLPEFRGKGYGKALIHELARIAVSRGCGRLEWWCLDWNKPSIDFYLSLGAEPMDEWTVYRITGDTLTNLAKGS